MMTRLWLWLRSVLFRTRLERDMQEEMAAHLRTATERFEASGLAPEAARAAAHREFGNVAALGRGARRPGRARIESVLADLRYGVRRLSRTPFSAITMIVVFALGIGFNAALFIFISSLVNSPVPGMTRDDSLVRIRGRAAGGDQHRQRVLVSRVRDYVTDDAVRVGRGVDVLGRGHRGGRRWCRRRSSAAPPRS